MRTDNKIAQALMGNGIEHADGALCLVTVPDEDAFGDGIVAKLIRILGIFNAVDHFVCIGIKNFA